MYIFYQCTGVHVPDFLELMWQDQNSIVRQVTTSGVVGLACQRG